MGRLSFAFLALALCAGCPASEPATDAASEPATEPAPAATAEAPPTEAEPVKRTLRPWPNAPDGSPMIAGISYGPFRQGQRPGGPDPTSEQIAEDLQILAPRWQMIRVYSSRGPTEQILRTVRELKLPMRVMVGAWIAADDAEANAAEIDGAIRLANEYPDVVAAVNVGNETQVFWSGHRSPPEPLIAGLRKVRAAIKQPVSTADDYNFWNKPESHAVAAEVDFLLLHAYAMWNKQQLDDAVSWTETTVDAIAKEHPDLPIVMGETGWATEMNPEGNEKEQIKAPAGEAEQKVFFEAFTAWAAERKLPTFYFEAFDEPWKGSGDPREVEKHWGIYNVDRTPKAVLKGAPQ